MLPAPLELQPSCIAQRFLIGVHLLALSVALCLPWMWVFPLALLIAASFLSARRISVPTQLAALPDGQLQVRWPDGTQVTAVVQDSSLLTAVLIVLHLKTESRRMALPLWRDSADGANLRQWRVWLRWQLPALKRHLQQQEREAA